MKRIRKKNIIVSIIMLILIILEIISIGRSRANKNITINLKTVDYNGEISTIDYQIEAISGQSGYYITLPKSINSKYVDEYYFPSLRFESKDNQTEEKQETSEISNEVNEIAETNELFETSGVNETSNEILDVSNEVEKTNTNQTQVKNEISTPSSQTTKAPGDVIYLTEDELKSKTISTQVAYDFTIEEDNTKLYYEQIIQNSKYYENDTNLILEGYMPEKAKIELEVLEQDKINDYESQAVELTESKNNILFNIYSFKIMNEETEYIAEKYNKKIDLKIKGIDENNDYTLVKLENEKASIVESTKTTDGQNLLMTSINDSGIYVVLMDATKKETKTSTTKGVMRVARVGNQEQEVWDGSTIATGYSYGDGTSSKPYLIGDGKELAYLANQVNNGTNYDGQYFQLIGDIDLGGNSWTPIGTSSNPFRGIFNGAGHTISNGTISTPTSHTRQEYGYGIFGFIGDGSSRTIIENVQFDNITMTLNQSSNVTSGNSSSYTRIGMGIVTGIMFNNSTITNSVVRNSSITASNSFTIRTYYFRLFVGGMVGEVENAANNINQVSSEQEYSIDNCVSDVDIDFDRIQLRTSGSWYSQTVQASYGNEFACGGILGGSLGQENWPTNSLYTGTITSNYAFIGPIQAFLKGRSTNITHGSNAKYNFNQYWNLLGNYQYYDQQSSSYYYDYSVGTRSFTSSVATGDIADSTTYRVSSSQQSDDLTYTEGVNKGIYTNTYSSRLSDLNSNATSNNLVSWQFRNNNYYLVVPFTLDLDDSNAPTYKVIPSEDGDYTYTWLINGQVQDNTTDTIRVVSSWDEEYDTIAIATNGTYFAAIGVYVPKLEVHFVLTRTEHTISATIEGTGTSDPNWNINDYTFKWQESNAIDDYEDINGATSLTLNNINKNYDYKIIGTNANYPYMSIEGESINPNRIVVFVDATNGDNSYDGYTPATAKKTMQGAYTILDSNGDRDENYIVVIGQYYTYSGGYYGGNSEDSTFLGYYYQSYYAKAATITGKYLGVDYNAQLPMTGGPASNWNNDTSKFLAADTTFTHLTWFGRYTNGVSVTSSSGIYMFLQGFSLTMGEDVTMTGYPAANTNQGLITGSAPAVHIFGGWERYNYATLPRTNNEIIIKSGTYGRVTFGSSSGVSGTSSLHNTTSRNFTGSSFNDMLITKCTIDIQNSTTPSTYTYDINLLGGGATTGNTYAQSTLNIDNGKIGRVLGGSIGDSSEIWSDVNDDYYDNVNAPSNTYIGSSTININGGTIAEVYGGCLGRNMDAIGGNGGYYSNYNICDAYYYGIVTINISGGFITKSIYGAGAGGVSGYNASSSDNYKSYGKDVETSVNINISGGTIDADVYGGGYGYTEYLTKNTTAEDGGTLYGNSYITVTGSPTINGNIYGGGRGYNYSGKDKIANMVGTSTIRISGTPTITGSIYGAGMGISGSETIANFHGTTNIIINTDFTADVYGGAEIAKTYGTTNVTINSGTHQGTIYGGGNAGIVTGESEANGTANVTINGGNNTMVFGGGNQATVDNTIVIVNDGTNTTTYGGGNEASVTTAKVTISGGTNTTTYGGGNRGEAETTTVTINGGANTTTYGGGNEASVTTATVTQYEGKNDTVFGGGNQGKVNNSTVYIKSTSTGYCNSVYGGGNQAGADAATVYIQATNKSAGNNVYGGSKSAGDIPNTYVYIESGTIDDSIYGGNDSGGTATNTYVLLNGEKAKENKIFGGGNKATSTTTEVHLRKGICSKAYGGGLSAQVTASNVYMEGATITESLFGGGSEAGISDLALINIMSGNAGNVYGGAEKAGEVAKTEITTIVDNTEFSGNIIIENIYAGNYLGGTTNDANVTTNCGTITNVYGGGYQAETTKTTVVINDGTITNVYGGGFSAKVAENTSVTMNGGSILNNIFGGGDAGEVVGNTDLLIAGGIVTNNAYAGGNGIQAIVTGNSTITIAENSTIGSTSSVVPQSGCVFGSGNAAQTGITNGTTSISTVNIIGGTIYGNVYGGANTSVTNGYAKVNIGKDATSNATYEPKDLYIKGTVFGGGESNAEGSEVYDFSAISVTQGIDVLINGNGYRKFQIDGSIFGSGDASSSSGTSTITLKNYGTRESPKFNVSIQRTNILIIDNSSVSVDGTTDRTNEYKTTVFSLSRIDDLKLKNGSTLYLNNNANLLKKFESLVDINGNEVKETAVIDEEGNTTTNVDNRLYLLEGVNLNIATNESRTAYGEVNGMTFLGMFTGTRNPAGTVGLYSDQYSNGDEITNKGTFMKNSYVLGLHKKNPEHNIKEDGFYTTINNDGIAKEEYVGVTPEDDLYYIWQVGDAINVVSFEINPLTASKYATLGTYELPLTGLSIPNTIYSLYGFSADLNDGIQLVDKKDIEQIAEESVANSTFGLGMQSGKSGWQTDGATVFLSENGGKYTGTTTYYTENSTLTPSLIFCIYHSQNLTLKQDLGTVNIMLQGLEPIDDLNYEIVYVSIKVKLTAQLYQDTYYEMAITPGEEFDLFSTTDTSIVNNGMFSTYYSLFLTDFSNSTFYEEYLNDVNCIVSRDSDENPKPFKAETKITMIDKVTNTTYYYLVTEEDEANQKYRYYVTDFIKMGSTNEKYDRNASYQQYYNSDKDILYENYIFHVDFGEANYTEDSLNNSLFMELLDSNQEVLIGVLGIQRENTLYSMYKDKSAQVSLDLQISDDKMYLGNSFDLIANIDYSQSIVSSKKIYDTTYFGNSLGLRITFYDNNGNQLSADSLIGVTFTYNNQNYYPGFDGSIRIKCADNVSKVLARIHVDTAYNETIATGNYTIKVESIISPDGRYFGDIDIAYKEKNITIINGTYGLKVVSTEQMKIYKRETGLNQNESNILQVALEYSSNLNLPKIAVCLERRVYTDIYSTTYEKVDLKRYVSNSLTTFNGQTAEYLVTSNPEAQMQFEYNIKADDLITGTYRLVYKLYDDTSYIGEAYEYFVIN